MPKRHEDVTAQLPLNRYERIRARTQELLAAESASTEPPLDGLAAHAVEEYRQGRTISLEAYAARYNINLTDE